MPRPLPILHRAALEAMPTGSLLSRLRELLACEDSRAASDQSGEDDRQAPAGTIGFKDSADWSEAHRELKNVLALREQLPAAAERTMKRLARAACNRSRERRK